MTVLPFPVRPAAPAEADGRSLTAAVTGTFWSPQGPAGTFTGTYRLERLLDQYGQTAAAGVFTGALVGAGGERLGIGSRRHTAAAELDPTVDGYLARVGPVDVNLLGFLVTVDEFTVAVPRALPEPPLAHLPATAGELLDRVVSAAGVDAAAARDSGAR
jgi:hypothetical protein